MEKYRYMSPSKIPYTEYNSLLQAFRIHAEYNKNRVFAHYWYRPEPSSTLEFKSLTFNQIDKMTDYLAEEWRKNIPSSSPLRKQKQCVVTLIEDSLQSILSLFAILKLGIAYFPIQDYYNEEVIAHLLEESNTAYIIASKIYWGKMFKAVELLRQSQQRKEEYLPVIGIKIWDDFNIDQLVNLTTETSRQQQQTKYIHNHANSIEFFELSGGSTGQFPKIIRRTAQQFLYSMMETMVNPVQQQQQEESSGKEKRWLESSDVVLFTYNVNVGSIITKLFACIFAGASVVVFRQSSPPMIHDILTAADICKASIMFGPPTILEKLALYILEKEDQNISLHERAKISNIFKAIKICLFAGAPLRSSVGIFLRSKGLNVRAIYGLAETGGISVYNNLCLNQQNRWNSIKFSSAHMNHLSFEPLNNDPENIFYHLVIRNTHGGLASGAGNRPNGDMATKDLFRKNIDETGDHWWTHCGRMNDVFIMGNGYKGTNPVPVEYEIYNEPIIQKCILIGENRSCNAVLIEVTNNKTLNKCSTKEDMVTKVYNAVHRANKLLSECSTIKIPNMVYILPSNKQLPLTVKGTVNRKQAMNEFHQEIEEMYSNIVNNVSITRMH